MDPETMPPTSPATSLLSHRTLVATFLTINSILIDLEKLRHQEKAAGQT